MKVYRTVFLMFRPHQKTEPVERSFFSCDLSNKHRTESTHFRQEIQEQAYLLKWPVSVYVKYEPGHVMSAASVLRQCSVVLWMHL